MLACKRVLAPLLLSVEGHCHDRIDDYALTAHANVTSLYEIVGKRVGDPKLGALAMIKAVEAETPPMHLVLGSDALGYLREHLAQLTSNLSAWESVSLSTDFAV
jgi:hypothetical protein